jgi:hypothetical protein
MLFAIAACGYNPTAATPGDDAGQDAAGDAAGDAPNTGRHLVISEIYAESADDEFIEIHNPLSVAFPLTDVYLTDINDYWTLPAGSPTPIGTSDFLVRFPGGSTIGPGATIVVAIDGPMFEQRFGVTPSFTIRTPTAGAAAMFSIVSLAAGTGGISDDGELLVLFEWDGARDLVRDLDIVVHGMPSVNSNRLVAKQPVDGPDADATPTAYAPDANVAMQMATRTDGSNESYQRMTLDEGETTTGGNGLTGHDETSEPLDTTWSATNAPNPGTPSF